VLTQLCDVNRRPTIGWVNGLFLRERTKTSRNVTISFSQSPERATATRGWVQLVFNKYVLYHRNSNFSGIPEQKIRSQIFASQSVKRNGPSSGSFICIFSTCGLDTASHRSLTMALWTYFFFKSKTYLPLHLAVNSHTCDANTEHCQKGVEYQIQLFYWPKLFVQSTVHTVAALELDSNDLKWGWGTNN
jgi:hypothetical protein